MQHVQRPATSDEVIEIIGPVKDLVLILIMETGATPTEVLEAFSWATADKQIGTELEHAPSGRVAQVYEILNCVEPEPDSRPHLEEG